MNKLVIFDLDGVLFESRDMHFDTLNEALKDDGFDPISREDHITRFNGLPTRTKLTMLGITGQDATDIQQNKQARTLGWVFKNVQRDEAFVTLFIDLHTRGWQIAVASNAIQMTVVRALQQLGLADLTDLICSGDDPGRLPKPDPQMYMDCIRVLGAAPSTTIIVEDSPVGREGAARTGAHVVCVTCPAEVDEAVRRATEVV